MAEEESRPSASKSHSSMVEQLTREPYTCERLTQIRGGYRPLTKSFVALHLDFCNPEVQTADDYDSATLYSVIGGSRSLNLMYILPLASFPLTFQNGTVEKVPF